MGDRAGAHPPLPPPSLFFPDEASYKHLMVAGAMAVVAQDIERDLLLCAATAVEDRLQDNVSDTLVSLMEADIKVCWGFNPHAHLKSQFVNPT
jgi:hypothetical protein